MPGSLIANETDGTVSFRFMLNVASGRDVAASWVTARGTAADGFTEGELPDYLSANGTVTIPTGTTLSDVQTVTIYNDQHDDPLDAFALEEYFFINVIGASNAGIGNNQTVVTINDDDGPGAAGDLGPWAVQFTQPTYTVVEGDTMAVIGVMRAPGSTYPYAVFYTHAGGTATAGATADYTAVQRHIVAFPADDDPDYATVTVPIHHDTFIEGDETVFLSLRNPTGGPVTGDIGEAMLIIRDNAPLPDLLHRRSDGDRGCHGAIPGDARHAWVHDRERSFR